MLDLSASAIWAEIEAAINFRDLHLEMMQTMVEEYAGEGYRSDWSGSWNENHFHESIRLTTSRIVFDNPKVKVRTRRPGTQKMVAKAMRHGINRWVKDEQLRRILKRIYACQYFAFDVAMTVMEHRPCHDPRDPVEGKWPHVYEIPPSRFFFDPLSLWYGQARYAGHLFVKDKADLLVMADTDESWNKDAIEEIAAGAGTEDLPERKQNQDLKTMDRKEIAVYEVWVPESDLADPANGFHGGIYTLAVSHARGGDGAAAFLRDPRPYFGPRWGPYSMFGVYPVPGDPFPLSPAAAMYRQIKELNEITAATHKAIKKYKRIVMVAQDNPDMVKKLAKIPDNFVIPVKGFDKKQIETIELGGITTQHKEQIAQALERVDRNTGISQIQRGNLQKGLTATEVAVADAASSEGLAFIKQEFADATVQVLNSAAWFLYNEDRVEFPLGEEAADELGMGEPWFKGGVGGGVSYDDLELEIEPMSMERMNEALTRSQFMDMLKMIMEAGPAVLAAPFFDWKEIFGRGGDVLNDPMLGEIFNGPLAARLSGMQAAQSMSPAPTSSPGGGSQNGGLARQFAGRANGAQLGGLMKGVK